MSTAGVGEGRDPAKRKVKPVEAQSLLDFDLGEGESSDDSDFRIEDHPEESDDYSINSDDEKKKGEKSEDSSEDDDSDGDDYKTDAKHNQENSLAHLLEKAKSNNFQYPGELANLLICAGCLGSRSDDYNEIVECDGCGITVHEGCYGVSDVTSESSTISSASTEPWFCEACKAGVSNPSCELCPNSGGIFKETEVGAWVHLVCALYIPGVAFSDVERLSGVTLFEMAYVRWGARACELCTDTTRARTGVCVGCDAGLCRTFFHVTCGQREGLLAEAHSEEVEQADPFYAHCRLHSDKTLIKKRKKNWLALQLRTEKRRQELQDRVSAEEKKRIERKLLKHRRKYNQLKENRNPPWVPTQKMARMLYSSASAMRKFQKKAECMGIDTHALEFQEAQIAALKDVSRRWHVQPAFSVEFVGYYLERNTRVLSLRASLERLTNENEKLVGGEEKLRIDYDEASKINTDALAELRNTRESVQKLYSALTSLCPNKAMPAIAMDTPLLPPQQPSTPKLTIQHLQKRGLGSGNGLGGGGAESAANSMASPGVGGGAVGGALSRPTAAALKMGVGFPLPDNLHTGHRKVLSTSFEAGGGGGGGGGAEGGSRACAACGRVSARHVLAACDTCARHYHPHCLTPPLPRPPKKTKLYGWQCSECDKSSDSEPEIMEKKVPRRSRIRYSKEGAILADQSSSSFDVTPPKQKQTKHEKPAPNLSPIKVTIKPFEFTSDHETDIPKKKEKKIKKKQKTSEGEISNVSSKKMKRSFTSPTLTNTPLMSMTPLVADSPNDSHNENSNQSASITKQECHTNAAFSSLVHEDATHERDTKTIESSIETTLANLSSDIATYKANRKRRKEKHRSRYSPDFVRSPSKHKHKRKKKHQDLENAGPHPRITIKIKPIQKPDGSFDTQIFYVPTDANTAPPPPPLATNQVQEMPPSPLASTSAAPTAPSPPPEEPPAIPMEAVVLVEKTKVSRASRGRQSEGAVKKPTENLSPMNMCDVCSDPGDNTNLVRCDECFRRYHFTCLEPPLNKNPKKRGYSWHCADCDPTDIEDNNR